MPRQNRYHPYANNRPSSSAGPLPSRYPRPPTLTIPNTTTLTTPSNPGDVQSFQQIYPQYIRGTTWDGKTLATKSILQGPDGVFYVQMQAARFPSECSTAGSSTSTQKTRTDTGVYERWVVEEGSMGRGFGAGLGRDTTGPGFGGLGTGMAGSLTVDLGGNSGSENGKSLQSVEEGDEDADGEEVDGNGFVAGNQEGFWIDGRGGA